MANPRGMARRRFRAGPVAAAALLVLLLFGGLAGSILLANQVTSLRGEIGRLARDQDTLTGQVALLTARWNAVASRAAVVARAQSELGLVRPDSPGTVVQVVAAAPRGRTPIWERVMGTVAIPAANATTETP